MPAITADTTTLAKLPTRSVTERDRPVVSVTTAPQGFEGEGFPVRRAFAGVDLALLDPFVHMDQMGEVDYAPYEPKGTDWHPHRGFETVTYIIDGTFQHQDSHGGGGVITNGATQWMTAGSGILHIETPPEQLVVSGGLFHGIQLWVNLPSTDKMTAPRYQNLEGDQSAVGPGARSDFAGEHDGRGWRASDHGCVGTLDGDGLEVGIELLREDDEGTTVVAGDDHEQDRATEVDDRATDLGAELELQ